MTEQPRRAAPAPVGRNAAPKADEGTATADKPLQQPVPGVNEMVAEALAAQSKPDAEQVEADRQQKLARLMAKSMGVDPDHYTMGQPAWRTFLPDAQMAIAAHDFFLEEAEEAGASAAAA